MRVIVIKGVPKAIGVREVLYETIKAENADKKPFWEYSFPHSFAGSVKSPNTNVKLMVRSWKYAGELLKSELIIGGLKRVVELYEPRQHNSQQQSQQQFTLPNQNQNQGNQG